MGERACRRRRDRSSGGPSRGRILACAGSLALLAAAVAPTARADPGEALWVSRYDGPESAHQDAGRAVAVSPDGSRVFVAGFVGEVAQGSAVFDYATLAYDAATGETVWVQIYNGPGEWEDDARAIAVSPGGGKVFVTGSAWMGQREEYDYVTIAYAAATGKQLWLRRYNGPAGRTDGAHSLAMSPNGHRVFVTGASEAPATRHDVVTIAYSARSGRVLWKQRLARSRDDVGRVIAASPDGERVFITGSTESRSTSHDYLMLSYSARTGERLWAKRYRGERADHPVSLAVDRRGTRVFVTGWTEEGALRGSSYTTLAHSAATGERIWTAKYDSPGEGAYAHSLAVSPDGSKVFVTGWSEGTATFWDYGTIAYRARSGAELWVARHDGGSNGFDGALALVADSEGTVYVTGASETGSLPNQDYLTIAYRSSDGSQRWSARYDGPARDRDGGYALALSPDGSRLFVTGESSGVLTGTSDIATISYSTK